MPDTADTEGAPPEPQSAAAPPEADGANGDADESRWGHLRIDRPARLAALRGHTRHSRTIEHWPIWIPELTTVWGNFTAPVWVYDMVNYAMVWGNAAAISLWRKADLDHFISTDYKVTCVLDNCRCSGSDFTLRDSRT